MNARREPCSYTKNIGFTISAYQEDPAYLRECLQSVRALQYPSELLHIVMVVDGNSEDDRYMMEMFREVFADQDPGCYIWQNNYHSWKPTGQERDAAEADGPEADDEVVFEDPQRLEVWRTHQDQEVCVHHAKMGRKERSDVYSIQGTRIFCGLHTG